MQTFTNLPTQLSLAIAKILSDVNTRAVMTHAQSLHDRYMKPSVDHKSPILENQNDMLAYLALRFPATYAQLYSALSQIKERLPHWQPKTMLDIGSGPGTAIFAAHHVWPSLTSATAIDQEKYFLALASHLLYDTNTPITVEWQKQRIDRWANTPDAGHYDLIVVANVINELPTGLKHAVLDKLGRMKQSVVVLLEPGTRHGHEIIQSAAKKIIPTTPLIAPYMDNNFIDSPKYWIHFSTRFIRPEFLRLVRQSMRDSDLMASDWEEAKFSYVAFGDVPTTHPYALVVGPIEKYHGYLQVPILTKNGIEKAKVMKRHKELYNFAKTIKWGETITNATDLVYTRNTHFIANDKSNV